MKTHLPLLLRKALLAACLTAAATFATPASAAEGPIDNTTYGWDGTVYHDHDILFEFDYLEFLTYSATLIGNDKYDADPQIIWTEDWDGEFASINAIGGSGIGSDIYIAAQTEIKSYAEVMASDSLIMQGYAQLTGEHVRVENSIFVDSHSNLYSDWLEASTLVVRNGGVIAKGAANLKKADQYRTWGLTAYWNPLGWYHTESGPTPFADDEKGCSILITDLGIANFYHGLTTEGNVYLHGNSHIEAYNGCVIGGDVKLYDSSSFYIYPLDPWPEGASYQIAEGVSYQIAGNVELYGNSFMGVCADTTINGNLSIESGHVLCVGAEDTHNSLTVGGNVSIGKDSSLELGKDLTVTGDLVMQEGSTFDGFTGNVSAKNMQLRGDISFTGNNRRISTTEDIQMVGGTLTFNGQGMEVSVGKNLIVKNGELSLTDLNLNVTENVETDKVKMKGGTINAKSLTCTQGLEMTQATINLTENLILENEQAENSLNYSSALTAKGNVSVAGALSLGLGCQLNVGGSAQFGSLNIEKANMQVNGNLNLQNGMTIVNNVPSSSWWNVTICGDIWMNGAMNVTGGTLVTGDDERQRFSSISADGGLFISQVEKIQFDSAWVDKNIETRKALNGITTIIENGGEHEKMVADIINVLDNCDMKGISFQSIDRATIGSLSTLGSVSIIGDSSLVNVYNIDSITADSSSYINELTDLLGTEFADIKLIEHNVLPSVEFINAAVSVTGSLYTNGQLSLSGGALEVGRLFAGSDSLSAISITNNGILRLRWGDADITSSGTLTVQDSSLYSIGVVTVKLSDEAIALAKEGGIEDFVCFNNSDVTTGTLWANGSIRINKTSYTTHNLEASSDSAGNIAIENGSTVNVYSGDLCSSGNVSIADSTLSVANVLSIGTSESKNPANLTIQSSSLTVGGKTNVAGDVTIANGEDNSLAFNADVTVGGNVNLQSGKLHFDAENKVSLTVGKDLTLGDGASLAGGVNLAVTGNLVMQQGSAFDGFSGNVSAKNMQLRGDLSFAGANRRISTTENLQMNGGDLSFSGSGMVVSVGKNLEVKNGGLSFNAVKADIGGDLVNQSAIGTKNSIAVDIKNGADVHVKGNLTGTDVTVLAADLTVDGKTNLDGNLTAWNGDSNALSFGDAVYTEGCIDVHGGLFTTWNKAGDSAAAITAVDGLTLTNVKQGQLGDVTVDNQSAASDIVATIGAVIAGGGIWGEVVAQVIGIIDDWNRSGITLKNCNTQSLGTLSTSGEIAISGGTYTGVELNADSESLISDIIHIIDKVMLPEIKLGERGITAAVTLTDTDVSLSGQIYSNGNLSVENTVLSAKNMKSTSSELASVSITDGSTVTLEEGLESSGAVSVENSVLRMGGDFSVDATDVAIGILESLGLVDVVSFVDCEEISIGGTFSSNSSTYISNTTLTAKEMELASEWIASDLRIVNGSKVSIAGAIRNEGSILIDGSTVSVGKGISTDEPTFRPEFSVATDIIINNHATVEVKGAVESADDLEVKSGSLLIVHNLKAENGETAASGDVVAADNVLVDTAEIRAAGNFSAGKEVTVKGEGAKLSVGGNTTIGDMLHIENKAKVNLNGQALINLTKLEMVNGELNLLNADGSVPTTAYNLVLNELVVEGNLNTMEANLIICDNATLTFSEGALLTMGCDVTLGSGTALNLEGDYEHSLVALFSGVDGLTLADKVITHEGLYDAYDTIATLNGEAINQGQYVISYRNGVVSFGAGSVPEPATATLSLLALAALAARRRRH